MKNKKPLLIWGLLLIFIVIGVGCYLFLNNKKGNELSKEQTISVEQKNMVPMGQVTEGVVFIQEIPIDLTLIDKFSVITATWARVNSNNNLFYLLDEKGNILYQETVNSKDVKDNQIYDLKINKPIHVERLTKIYFIISSPDGDPKNNITLWLNSKGINGRLFKSTQSNTENIKDIVKGPEVNGTAIAGNIVYKIHGVGKASNIIYKQISVANDAQLQPLGQIVKGVTFIQEIPITFQSIEGIEVVTATWARINTNNNQIHILDRNGKTLYQENINSKEIKDNSIYKLKINKSIDTRGLDKLYLTFSSNDGLLDNNITLWYNPSSSLGNLYKINNNMETDIKAILHNALNFGTRIPGTIVLKVYGYGIN